MTSMAQPFRLNAPIVAPVFALLCALFAAGCGGSFSGPADGAGATAGTSQAGAAQGGGAQGGSSGAGAAGGNSQICGGLRSVGCAKGQYCALPPTAQCGTGDQTGSCAPIPSTCGEIYAPVCGCDDRTYPNACSAAMAGVSVTHLAACESKPACLVNGVTYPDGTDGIPAPDGCNICSCAAAILKCTLVHVCPAPKNCGARAGNTCNAAEYCAYVPGGLCGATDAEAVCKTRPSSCVAVSDTPPVCGCDGNTYSSDCVAAMAGTGVLQAGACPSAVSSCTVGGVTYPDGVGNIPAADGCNICSCTGGSLACTKKACPKPVTCGGFTGQLCAGNQYCAYVPGQACGAADASATCLTRPDGCTADVNPVCGCDNKTYSNACQAAVAGVGYSKTGACTP